MLKKKKTLKIKGFQSELEIARVGSGEGISTHLAKKQAKEGPDTSLSAEEKSEIIRQAAIKFGEFLTALGVDWQNDPHSADTPKRVAGAYVLDLWKGRYERTPRVTTFPNERGYDGLVFEGGIPLTSMCAHHHQAIIGIVHVAYIPDGAGRVIGLSKLNRIVEHFARRAVIQEGLTMLIHNAIDKISGQNRGVAVVIAAGHHCVKCRGVKHHDTTMKTYKFSGDFEEPNSRARSDFYQLMSCRTD